VRAALGASDSDIGRMILRQAAGQLLAALAAGLPLAALSAKALGAVLFGVPPWDPLTLAAATLLLALAMLAANWIPARRAMRIEPAVALRHE
jgi:ABC-type antimicrobial peptide transport system permease subunit